MIQRKVTDRVSGHGNSNPPGRKACIPCARAKRTCDKEWPSCGRCQDRTISCQYDPHRPYARHRLKAVTIAGSDSRLDPGHVGALHTDAFLDSAWFLGEQSWNIGHASKGVNQFPKIRVSILRDNIACVRRWLAQWVDAGHCAFIHRQLFSDTGLPPCLQDAYSTLTVYAAKNEKNQDIVWYNIEAKVNRLLDEQQQATPILSTLDQLARVISLFIYQFIRLFDGDVRQRAQAEQHGLVLRSWVTQLWESASLQAALWNTVGDNYLSAGSIEAYSSPSPSDCHNDSHTGKTRLWREWVLAESVRRVWIVTTYIEVIFVTLRDGQSICQGNIAYTARRGLWDAPSAATWANVLRDNSPLFGHPYQSDRLYPKTRAVDIDPLGMLILSLMYDSDDLDSWIAKSSELDLGSALRTV
ncbi:hypothetical protein NQ176_g664 [Zarea fungicola]|uniref:Uncharacterized protein n=1 Tax=Zarea fungicola TaxID=93591 RepID=A0ACC1NXE6_9HYPO|nr:hypothetical protein NQ176_g664 [Lecanicillium fungicola]